MSNGKNLEGKNIVEQNYFFPDWTMKNQQKTNKKLVEQRFFLVFPSFS